MIVKECKIVLAHPTFPRDVGATGAHIVVAMETDCFHVFWELICLLVVTTPLASVF